MWQLKPFQTWTGSRDLKARVQSIHKRCTELWQELRIQTDIKICNLNENNCDVYVDFWDNIILYKLGLVVAKESLYFLLLSFEFHQLLLIIARKRISLLQEVCVWQFVSSQTLHRLQLIWILQAVEYWAQLPKAKMRFNEMLNHKYLQKRRKSVRWMSNRCLLIKIEVSALLLLHERCEGQLKTLSYCSDWLLMFDQ